MEFWGYREISELKPWCLIDIPFNCKTVLPGIIERIRLFTFRPGISSFNKNVHLTRCLRTLRAARGCKALPALVAAREGFWLKQTKTSCMNSEHVQRSRCARLRRANAMVYGMVPFYLLSLHVTLSNLLSARSLLSHSFSHILAKGASKMLRATGHARMVTCNPVALTGLRGSFLRFPGVPRQCGSRFT